MRSRFPSRALCAIAVGLVTLVRLSLLGGAAFALREKRLQSIASNDSLKFEEISNRAPDQKSAFVRGQSASQRRINRRPVNRVGARFALPDVLIEPQIVVGKNIQISASNPNEHHAEVIAAADPSNASRLVACSMLQTGRLGAPGREHGVVYTSLDGGATWMQTLQTVAENGGGDPDCTYASDGTAYYNSMGQSKEWHGRISELYRSTDGGGTWSEPFFSPGVSDRPWIGIDRSKGSNRGAIYLTYQSWIQEATVDLERSISTLVLRRSVDGGITWSREWARHTARPSQYEEARETRANGGTPYGVVVISDGTALLPWKQYQPLRDQSITRQSGAFYLMRLSNAGDRLEASVKIADAFEPKSWGGAGRIAADESDGPYKDRVYFVWSDSRVGRDAISLSLSSDGGKTWSAPQIIDDVAQENSIGPNNFQATVAVNKNGVVGVMWYDRRESLSSPGYTVRFRASMDGGVTWLPSVKVSSVEHQFGKSEDWNIVAHSSALPGRGVQVSVTSDRWLNSGHTAGLAADAKGVFHAVWVDNRTGFNQLWTAPVSVAGVAVKNSLPELSALDDVSERVKIDSATLLFNSAEHTATIRAKLTNRGDEKIRGPLRILVTDLNSKIWTVAIRDSDNNTAGIGALWTVGLPAGGLAPGETIPVGPLSFRVEHIDELVPVGLTQSFELMRLTMRVYGRMGQK
jgi:hypothetical protein